MNCIFIFIFIFALLENKIWRAKFLSEKSYTQKIEFRDCVLYEIFTQKERRLQ